MAHYRIAEWAKYQHYKDRDPPWIKLHRDLLTSQTWVMLPDAGRALAVACMLVAAGTENKIPADPNYLKRRAYLNGEPDFAALVKVGFLEFVNDDNAVADASNAEQTLANDTKCYSETEERREEKNDVNLSELELEQVRDAYAAFVLTAKKHGWPTPRNLDADRKRKLRARLKDHGLDGWQQMLGEAETSDWLRTEFKLRLDWILEPRNFRKVIEGNYRNAAAEGPQRKVVRFN